jgi:hypothetical protein
MTELIERRIGETSWYVLTRRYPTAYAAAKGWERATHKLKAIRKRGGVTSVGLTRHAHVGGEAVFVSAVSLERDQVVRTARLLGGEPYELDDQGVEALIVRRAKVVLEHARPNEPGRFEMRRPDGRGAQVTVGGDVIEPTPGQG